MNWTLEWTFPGNQKVTDLWNGTVAQKGAAVTVKYVWYDHTIAAGATVDVGFVATYAGSNPKPAAFKLNGQAYLVK